MSAMDLDYDASTFLATLRSETESSELINLLYQLEDFYERKLWHQLTLTLDEFYSANTGATPELKYKFYTSFISQFSSKLNSIKVVDFVLQSYLGRTQDTLDKLIELKGQFIEGLKKSNNVRNDDYENDVNARNLIDFDESVIYVNLQIARYYLLLNDVSKAQEILDTLSERFDSGNSGIDNSKVNAAYYLTKCELYKINENYNLFYSNGLLYLSSLETNLSDEEKVKLCYELCIAALLGDKIYNFGELILHDILKAIEPETSEYHWLYQLIQNLNSGNLNEFIKWIAISFKKSPFLAKSEVFLKQKIIIMSLLELISTKSTTNKQLSFEEISTFTGTPVNDVEHLIIKCFSLNLIKGYINQIDQILVVTWLQPRILNLDQVKVLYNHLLKWDNQVEELGKNVYKNGGTVWAGM